MSLIGFKARNDPQQIQTKGANPKVDERATTQAVFGPLDERFRFTVDVAASEENAKLDRYFDREADGLSRSWAGERVWCNPPYSDIRPWLEKAWAEQAELVVMLLPANRTEQGWWQDLVEPYRDQQGSRLRTEFVRGRTRFLALGALEIGPNERPPFGCVLLIWGEPE